jgi:hypothetical protein
MAVTITPATNLNNADFVSTTSRYLNSPIIYWGNNNVITFTTYKRAPLVFSDTDKYMLITRGLEYRPDLIMKKAYGVALMGYWWKVMEANRIFDVFDLKSGLTLRIPGIL